jgi:hypothetical protein
MLAAGGAGWWLVGLAVAGNARPDRLAGKGWANAGKRLVGLAGWWLAGGWLVKAGKCW